MRRVVVLRPEPAASATVSQARERGLDAVAVPLFEVGPLEWNAPAAAGFDGLLLTSANAVRQGGPKLESLRALPVYAVGNATAEGAREGGFDIAATGDDGVDRLLSSIEPGLRLLHLCGAHRREPRDARQRITALPVYRSEEIEDPDLQPLRDCVVLVHSPRAGRRLAELVEDRGEIVIAAISAAAADAAGAGWGRAEIADQPTDDALLALAARLCNNPAQR